MIKKYKLPENVNEFYVNDGEIIVYISELVLLNNKWEVIIKRKKIEPLKSVEDIK